jgi:hypothetical protein
MQLTVTSVMTGLFSEIFSVRNYLTRHKLYRVYLRQGKLEMTGDANTALASTRSWKRYQFEWKRKWHKQNKFH